MGAKEFSASTTIDATPDKIWAILMDTPEYPEWDPYCDKIEGDITLGSKLKAFSKLSPGRAFRVKVTELRENEKMVWSGGMPLGLFKGVRTFSLEKNGESTDFSVQETFSGPMMALIGGSIPDMTEPFEKFVEGLKQRAERT